ENNSHAKNSDESEKVSSRRLSIPSFKRSTRKLTLKTYLRSCCATPSKEELLAWSENSENVDECKTCSSQGWKLDTHREDDNFSYVPTRNFAMILGVIFCAGILVLMIILFL